jgi:hypothetical protein
MEKATRRSTEEKGHGYFNHMNRLTVRFRPFADAVGEST